MSANLAQSADKGELVIYIDKANQVSTIVPRGWRRKLLENNQIVYISPNQQVISSMEQLTNYLLLSGTCKCNLSCPFFLDELFNFDPRVESEEGVYETMRLGNCKHVQRPIDSSTDSHKFIVQNPINSMRTSGQAAGQPVTIGSLLNCKPPNVEENGGQIFGYIPVNISKGLNMANLISQPIILSSPIKATTATTTSTSSSQPQVLQILNPTSSPMLQSTMLSVQPSQTSTS